MGKCPIKSEIQEYNCSVLVSPRVTGLDKDICFDGCMFFELKQLWDKGIKTLGCCCGKHVNSEEKSAYIQVAPEFVDQMLEIGYEFEKEYVWAFKPKKI